MDSAIVTGLATLGGVIVGGWITYGMERRREGWTAKKDARLFIPHLHRLWQATDEALEHGWTWDDLCGVIETNVYHWQERYAEVFAGTLTWEQWTAVYSAVRPFQQVALTAPRDGIRITEDAREDLQRMIDDAIGAVYALTPVALYGPGPQIFRRIALGLRWRFRPPPEAQLLKDLGIEDDELDRRPPDDGG